MTYNSSIFKNVFEYVQWVFDRIQDSDEQGRTIKVTKYEVVEPENEDINYLVNHELTGQVKVLIYFEIYNVDGELVDSYSRDLFIPKLINNVFVIDGKLRIPTNVLDNDYHVRVYQDSIIINNDIRIEGNEKDFVITVLDDDYNKITIQGTDEDILQHLNILKLGEIEKYKLQIKLDIDDVGEYLTKDIVRMLYRRGPDNKEDNIIDKRINTTESNLMDMLRRWKVRNKIVINTRKKFIQYGTCFLTDIQNSITRYFRVADENTVDVPSTINPLVFDALKYKIVIPKQVAYTRSMTDIIDIVNTPINNNVNKINEMTICSTVENGELFIYCYVYPTGEKVKVNYLQYLNSKVLKSEYWDYDDKSIKFSDEGRFVEINLRQITRKLVESNIEEIQYIEPHPDERLSLSTRQIPMINMSDTIRLAMATSMEKQALSIQDSEPRLVSSGHDDTDFINSTLITKYTGSGAIVKKIMNNKVFIEDKTTGSLEYYDVPAPTVGLNDSTITFNISVKEGQELVKGDPIIVPHVLRSKSFDLGINTRVAYMDYLGYTHEDSIVVSESYADKMKHFTVTYVSKPIYSKDIIRYLRKVGSKVTSGTVLINLQSKMRTSKELETMYQDDKKGLMKSIGFTYDQSNLIAPNNCDEGYVVDVNINLNNVSELESDYSIKVIEEFDKSSKVSDYDWIPEEYKVIKAYTSDFPGNAIGSITYAIVQVKRLKPGDKVCNTYGGKGIIGLVLPDECMPRLDLDGEGNGPAFELIMNPPSVISRKNPSQIYECALTNCIEKIYERVNDYIENNDIKSAKDFLKQFYGKQFDNLTDEEFIVNHNKGISSYRMKVGCYSKVNHNQVVEWMRILDVKEKEYIYCPDVTIVHNRNDNELRAYSPDKYVKKEGDSATLHELGFVENPILYGKEYMLKLYHSGDYTGKVANAIVDAHQPVMGRGIYHDEGQKIGEMELWALLSYGTENFVRSQNPNLLNDQYNFINELLLAGYAITDNEGFPLLSNYKEKLHKLQELGKK